MSGPISPITGIPGPLLSGGGRLEVVKARDDEDIMSKRTHLHTLCTLMNANHSHTPRQCVCVQTYTCTHTTPQYMHTYFSIHE